MFWAAIWKNIRVFIWKFPCVWGEIFYIFEQACFRHVCASVVSYVALCCPYLLLLISHSSVGLGKGNVSWFLHTLDIFTYLSCQKYSSRKHTCIILTLLNPTFIQWNWGLHGYTLFFLISAQNIDWGYSLEPPHRGGSNEYHNLYFQQKYKKYQSFYLKKFIFLGEIFSIFE